MPLDPQAKALLEEMKDMPDITAMEPAAARETMNEIRRGRRPYWQPVAKCQNLTVPGPEGPIPVRVYAPAISGELPGLVYFHGGGFVLGNLDSCDGVCNVMADAGTCVVISVDYHLAPEHKFPSGAQDCLAVTQWVASNARQLQVDPRRISVGGESAGGNLAAVVALAARDRGGPRIASQVLVYPVTDARMEAPSYQENGEGYFLTRAMMEWFWKHYLDHDDDPKNPFISPLHAKSLQALPPALVITAEFDPLRDEGEAYAARLDDAGVPVTCTRYPGMIHGFVGMAERLDLGRRAIVQITNHLRASASGYSY